MFRIHTVPKLKLWFLAAVIGICGCNNKNIPTGEGVSFFKRVFDRDTYRIYRIDIQQGNALPEEKVAQLKPGLTKEQIVYLLGTPVTTTMFHRDRWDYVYYMKTGETQQRELYTIVLFFDEDTLTKIKKTKRRTKDA